MPEPRKCPECGTELPADDPNAPCPKCMLEVGMGSQPGSRGDTQVVPPAPPPPPAPADLAKHFPQLEIVEVLGQGGMGIVYKARQPKLDRFVALKILPADPARDPSFAERFAREARALARLSHPHIVAVYDFGETEGMFYFIMEFVDGLNLRQLEQTGGLTPREALNIVPAICDALQYAHDQGIVHRDIKPENVLLDKRGRVKIADFGLAKLLGRPAPELTLTRAQQVMGTPNYMAPEQMERPLEVDHRADIYSLGVVFYEMLTGELPLGRFAPPSQKVQVDVRLDQVVLRALEKERDRRYQHASEVKTDVEEIATNPGGKAPVRAGPKAFNDWMEARRAVKAPAIGLLIAGIFNWLLLPFYTFPALWLMAPNEKSGFPPALLIVVLLAVVVTSSFIIVAALKMKALEAYRVAVAGSVAAILISPGNLIGLPIGIWALVTLSRRSVKETFGVKPPEPAREPFQTGDAPVAAPADPARKWFFVAATVFLAGVGLVVALVLGGLLLSIALPAFTRARHQAQALAAARAAQHEAAESWLRASITQKLDRAGVQYDSMQLRLDPSIRSGRITFTGLRERKGPDGKIAGTPIQGELNLIAITPQTWHVSGTKQLGHITFDLQAPAAATVGPGREDGQVLKSFSPSDPILAPDVTFTNGAWFLNVTNAQVVRLFEWADPNLDQGTLLYRAQLKTDDVQGRAYLEMLCRFPGRGTFFSRGLQNSLSGTTDWTACQIPFLIESF
jgi:tRNA A-37 threonylcarbamoyl transferase component Bud32